MGINMKKPWERVGRTAGTVCHMLMERSGFRTDRSVFFQSAIIGYGFGQIAWLPRRMSQRFILKLPSAYKRFGVGGTIDWVGLSWEVGAQQSHALYLPIFLDRLSFKRQQVGMQSGKVLIQLDSRMLIKATMVLRRNQLMVHIGYIHVVILDFIFGCLEATKNSCRTSDGVSCWFLFLRKELPSGNLT